MNPFHNITQKRDSFNTFNYVNSKNCTRSFKKIHCRGLYSLLSLLGLKVKPSGNYGKWIYTFMHLYQLTLKCFRIATNTAETEAYVDVDSRVLRFNSKSKQTNKQTSRPNNYVSSYIPSSFEALAVGLFSNPSTLLEWVYNWGQTFKDQRWMK